MMFKNQVHFFILLISLFTVISAANATPQEFTGHWQGKGTFQSAGMLTAGPADFDLKINHTENQLSIKDCWTVPDEYLGHKTTCYQSDYTLNDAAQVFLANQKIGDVFPGRISVFQGNSQVSELMTFDLNGRRDILLNYSWHNMDGEFVLRVAKLQIVP